MGKRSGKETKKLEQHECAEKEEKEIVQEILVDADKCFNNDNNARNTQQLIGCKDLFRGLIVK